MAWSQELTRPATNQSVTSNYERVSISLKYRLQNIAEAYMSSRYVAPKLFFALAALFALVGAALVRRGVIGTGLTGTDYLNPLFWVSIPRLIPFAASIWAAWIALIY